MLFLVPRLSNGGREAANDPVQWAHLRASLAGFEERLRRCRRGAQSILDEHNYLKEDSHNGRLKLACAD
jgi:hypothetical protein